jgi:hypothetical protein
MTIWELWLKIGPISVFSNTIQMKIDKFQDLVTLVIYSSSWYSPDNMTHDVFESGINGWFQESSNYPSNLISSFVFQQHGPMTGHFTQVVWAETEQVLKHYCFILHCLLFLIIYKKLFRLVVV